MHYKGQRSLAYIPLCVPHYIGECSLEYTLLCALHYIRFVALVTHCFVLCITDSNVVFITHRMWRSGHQAGAGTLLDLSFVPFLMHGP